MAMAQGYTTAANALFPEIQFPEWRPDEMFRLWMAHRKGNPTPEQRNQLILMLLIKISMELARQGWIKELDKCDGAAAAASDIAFFVSDRIDRYKLKVPWESLSDADGGLVVIKMVNTTCYRRGIEKILAAKARRDRSEVLPAHDSSSESLDSIPAPARNIGPELERLAQKLSDEETLEVLLRNYPGDIFAGESIALAQQSALLTRGELLRFDELDESLQAKCTPEAHALVTTRLTRFVHAYAADLN